MHFRIASKRGFTLVEVVVSITVFSFLMLVFSTSVILAEKTSHMNGQYAQAISLCQHKIDQMRAVGYGRINYTELSYAGIIDDAPENLQYSFVGVDEVANYLPNPTARINIQSIGTDKIKVTVTIKWKVASHESKTSSTSLSAIVTNVE